MDDATKRLNLSRFLVMGTLLLVCIGLEYYFHFLLDIHIVYTHLFYIPIVLAAIWWGLKGGLPVSLILAFLYAGSHFPNVELSVLSRGLMFVLVGTVMGIVSDGRKRAEKELRKKKEAEAIFLGSGDGMRTIDTGYKITNQNEEMGRLCGIEKIEAVGKKCSEICPSSLCNTDKCPLRQILSGTSRVEIETEITSVKRENIFVSLLATALKDDEGKVIGAIESFRDITKRKRAEEALRKTNRALKTLSESNQALVRATKESDLLQSICQIIVNVGGYRLAWVGFAEQDEKKSVRPVAQARYEEGYIDTLNITWGDTERGRGPTGTAIRTGVPSIVRDISTDSSFKPWRSEATKRGYASSIALPLLANEQTIGALNIYAVEPDSFDSEEVKMLVELADDLAYGIATLRARAEHKRAEEALEESEARYRSFIEGAHDMIQSVRQDASFEFVNRAWLETLGYTEGELSDIKLWDIISPDSLKHCQNLFPKAMAGETITNFQATFMAKDGGQIIVEGNVFPRYVGGKVIATQGFFHDITERKQAEERLREGEELKSSILKSISHAVVVLCERQIIFANEGVETVFGWKPEELIGQSTRLLYRSENEFKEIGKHFYPRLEKQRTYGEEFPCRRKDDKDIMCMVTASTIGKTLKDKKIVVVYEDVTERKKTEKKLESRVTELTALSEISTDIGSTLELDKVLNLSLESAIKLLNAECGSIMLLNEEEKLLAVAASSCLSSEFTKAQERLGEGIAGYVTKTGEPLLLKKDLKDTRFEKYKKKRKIKDALSVPIRTKDKIIGAFNVDNKREKTFTQGDLRLFTILASEVGAAIENA